MKKKLTALALVICLLAVAVVGGTMAYFTDTDEATNTFTVGNVKIELEEKMATTTGWFPSKYVDWEEQELVPGEVGYNKVVLVKNTGENDAFVRVKIRHDALLEPVLNVGSYLLDNTDSSLADGGKAYETIDGIKYVVYTIYTTSPVKAGYYFDANGGYDPVKADGEMDAYQILQNSTFSFVLLDKTFDWFDKDNGWFSYVSGGKKTVVMSENGAPSFNVDVIVEAIQADGFDNYTAAFAAFDAQK